MTETVADNAVVNFGTSQAASADLASDTDTSADTSAGMTVRRRRRFHENRIDQVGSRKREKAARRRRRRTGGRGTIGTEVLDQVLLQRNLMTIKSSKHYHIDVMTCNWQTSRPHTFL